MTGDADNSGQIADSDDTPESLAADTEFQAALHDSAHPAHKQAVARQTRAYAAVHKDDGHAELADQFTARTGEGSKPLEVTHDPLAQLAAEVLGKHPQEADQQQGDGERPNLEGSATARFAPGQSARDEVEAALEGVSEGPARALVATFAEVIDRGPPSYAEGREALDAELGRVEGQRTVDRAQQALKSLPNARTIIKALEDSGVGNSPEIIKAAARLVE